MTRQQKKEFERKRKAAKREGRGKGFDVERTPFRVNAEQAELQSFFDKPSIKLVVSQ